MCMCRHRYMIYGYTHAPMNHSNKCGSSNTFECQSNHNPTLPSLGMSKTQSWVLWIQAIASLGQRS